MDVKFCFQFCFAIHCCTFAKNNQLNRLYKTFLQIQSVTHQSTFSNFFRSHLLAYVWSLWHFQTTGLRLTRTFNQTRPRLSNNVTWANTVLESVGDGINICQVGSEPNLESQLIKFISTTPLPSALCRTSKLDPLCVWRKYYISQRDKCTTLDQWDLKKRGQRQTRPSRALCV